MQGKLEFVSLKQIRENKDMLRGVNRSTAEYLELVDSVRKTGVLNPISVRPMTDATTGESYYALIDGLQRTSASRDAGLSEIPALITQMDDGTVLEAQIIGNIQRIETRPAEYSEQLKKILNMNPAMTLTELSGKLSKSTAWLSDRLSLLKLHRQIQPLVDEGRISLPNAYVLSKLDEEEQLQWVDRAMTTTPDQFVPAVHQRKKEMEKAKREGRDPAPTEFVATPYARKVKELNEEMTSFAAGQEAISRHGLSNPAETWAFAIQWVMNMDPDSLARRKKEDDDRRASLEAKKTAAKNERTKVKAAEAQVKAARLQVEAECVTNGVDPTQALKDFDAAHAPVAE